MSTDYDVIVVGGGISGAVCAATLQLHGVRTLLISETRTLGRNTRSVGVAGHTIAIQPPVWGFTWNNGGAWARCIREHNLPTRLHMVPEPQLAILGNEERISLPLMMSARALTDSLFQWLPFPLPDEAREEVEQILNEGMLIPSAELSEMHDLSLVKWLELKEVGAATKFVVLNLIALLAGLPVPTIEEHFSVYGAFASLRLTLLTGDGTVVLMEPDVPRGLILPLADRVEQLGGEVWKGSPIDRVLIEDGRAVGVRTKDGRVVRAAHIALAVGNPRLPAFFDSLPQELDAPLSKELPLQHEDLFIIRVFDRKVMDLNNYLMIADLEKGLFNWIVPDVEMAPWNHTEHSQGKQVAVVWGSRGRAEGLASQQEFEDYLDDVGERTFPGWKSATIAKSYISHAHHWMNPLYIGPKVPRRSPTYESLWYCGDGTTPVSGLASEQAAFAGRHGAESILVALGKPAPKPSLLTA
jgi:hypothetical protein